MPLRLMCLTAHPDDEAGAFGAALLRAAARGMETAVLCLTEGAAGSYREPGQTDEELAALRRVEFHHACKALGVKEFELLQYPDGGLWREPFLDLVELLMAAIRRFRPHLVLTFGAEGGVNLHRDHTVISLAATAAFHWAGRTDTFPGQLGELTPWAAQKLYYAATAFLSTRDEQLQRTGTRTPASLHFELGPLAEQKFAAFAQHASQRGVLERVRKEYPDIFQTEDYLLAAVRHPVAEEQNLWDGISDED